jgi:hypothetical protein
MTTVLGKKLVKLPPKKTPEEKCDGCENGLCGCEGLNGWKIGGSPTSRICSDCRKPTNCGTYNADDRWECDECSDPEKQWMAVMRPWAPTWKVEMTSHDEETWKLSLYQWKGGWVHIDDQYEGLQYQPVTVNFIVPPLPGELRVVYDSADESVEATVVFTDDNDDGPCLYLDEGVVVVEDPDNVCSCMECGEPIEGITSYEFADDSKLHLCAACEAAQA